MTAPNTIQVNGGTTGVLYVLGLVSSAPVTLVDTSGGTARVWSCESYPSDLSVAPTVTNPTSVTATFPAQNRPGTTYTIGLGGVPGKPKCWVALVFPNSDGNSLPSPGFDLLGLNPREQEDSYGALINPFLQQLYDDVTGLVKSPTGGDDTALIAAALTASDNVILGPGVYILGSDQTVGAAGKLLNFQAGAELAPASGKIATLDCDYNAAPGQRVFSGAGTVLFAATGPTSATAQHFGAVGDGSTDDTPAWLAVLAAMKNRGIGGKIVGLSGAAHKLTGVLTIDWSGCTIEGNGAKLTTDETAGDGFIPLLVQDNQGDNQLATVSDLCIRDLVIEMQDAGPDNGSFLQLNAVDNFRIERVTCIGDGAGMGGIKTDGISLSNGTSNGVIDGCIVDGFSKGAFYAALCQNVIFQGCIARNGYESANPLTIGFTVGNSRNVTFDACHAHDNRGVGFLVQGVSFLSTTLSTLTNQTHFRITSAIPLGSQLTTQLGVFNTSTKLFEGLDVLSATVVPATTNEQWDIVLNSAPVFTLTGSMTVYAAFQPPNGIALSGCTSVDNVASGDGSAFQFVMGIGVIGAPPADTVVSGCVFSGGINAARVIGCQGLRLVGCDLGNASQIGIVVQDIGAGQTYPDSSPAENQTNDVSIEGGAIHGSGFYNAFIAAANDVTIDGTRFYGGPVGIHLAKQTVVTTDKVAARLNVLDPVFYGYASLAAAFEVASGADPTSGHYRIEYPTSPITDSFHAPPGSLFLDTAAPSSGHYFKSGSGFGATTWTRTLHLEDATTTATADKLVLRDGSGNGAFVGVNVSGLTASYAVVTDGSKNLASLAYTSAATASTLAARDSSGDCAFHTATASLQVTTLKVASAAGLTLDCATGNVVTVGCVADAAYLVIYGSNCLAVGAAAAWQAFETATPSFTQQQRTSDAATHDMTIRGQAPYASATGTNRNPGRVLIDSVAPVAGGTVGSVELQGNSNTYLKVTSDGKIGFYGHAAAAQQSVTGVLSAVIDANAKNVLTSIIAALVATGLVTDGTT